MQMKHYDLFVIGGGSGGVAAARASASLGANVAIAEGDKFGGTCVNRGCMPKKFYMYASMCAQEFETAKSYGWDVGAPTFDWNTLKTNTFNEIKRLNGIYDTMLGKANVDIYSGFASFVDSNTVEVKGEKITADKFIIAVGGKPYVPEMEGAEHAITSDEIFHLDELPKKMIVVGGGYIAIEFAGIFNALGVDVTLMVRGNQILKGFDEDVRYHVRTELEKKGIVIKAATKPLSIRKSDDGGLVVHCNHEGNWPVDQIMMATGRVPMLDKLGLNNTDVKLDERGQIMVDAWQQTSTPHIYAVGDTTNLHHNLTPVAINEGRAFADTHFGGKKRNIDDFIVPTAVFCQPQIGTVGLTEVEACEQYDDVNIFMTSFGSTKYRLSDSIDEKLMMKLLVDVKTDKVVGAHMVGPDAGEIIQMLGVALRAGATKHEFDRTVGVHPTISEEFVTMREVTRKGCLKNDSDT